jgi:hypothetical protein
MQESHCGTSSKWQEQRQIILCVLLVAPLLSPASAWSQTAGEFWPVVNVHFQLPDTWRLLGFVGSKQGEDFPYHQVNAGLGLGYQ